MTGAALWDLIQGAVWIAAHDEAMVDAAGERRNRQGRGIRGRPLGDWFAHERGFPAAFERLCSAIREGRLELWGRSRLGAPLEAIPAIEFRGLEIADSWRGLVAFQRGDAADELAWRRRLRARGAKLPGYIPDDPADGCPQILDPVVQPHAWHLRVDKTAIMGAFPVPRTTQSTGGRPGHQIEAAKGALRELYPPAGDPGSLKRAVVLDEVNDKLRERKTQVSKDTLRRALHDLCGNTTS